MEDEDFRPKTIDDSLNLKIKISDFQAMYIAPKIPNDREYDIKVKQLNNEKVKYFCETILPKYADKNGKITVQKAIDYISIFEEGIDVRESKILYNLNLIHYPDQKQVDYWLDVFSKDLEEIYKLGLNAIGLGYGALLNHFRRWCVEQKYEKVFSSPNPHDWFELAKKHIKLMKGEDKPFDIFPIKQKADTLLRIRITPKY